MKRFLALLCVSALAPAFVAAAGLHNGEAAKITAQVSFLSPAGETFTDASGIRYTMNGWTFSSEPKVYPAQYWGRFPLYFTGSTMNFSVTLSNTAAKGNKSFKVRVEAVHNVLETSGAPGMTLAPTQTWVVESLAPGESKTLQGSAYIPDNPNLPSGLDLTKIRILHLNEGANPDAGLIKEQLAVWCPPPANKKP
ncbi:MAG TPA: hypothetical protein DEB40_07875 [Elusimicrobia bacterium]|nr:hypothetical protein [Elusimicrobiota bacterium]HBT61647.1 hypothetical protein [Elusimicrobiota bacterium]